MGLRFGERNAGSDRKDNRIEYSVKGNSQCKVCNCRKTQDALGWEFF